MVLRDGVLARGCLGDMIGAADPPPTVIVFPLVDVVVVVVVLVVVVVALCVSVVFGTESSGESRKVAVSGLMRVRLPLNFVETVAEAFGTMNRFLKQTIVDTSARRGDG